ncbi:DUF2732 family protein [Erwinia sp. JH02]|uniref:DUF2732 family protein n=1 Tax=Erwinia sp. JH02 TaxID=2733394 RepID=UPI001488BB7C|nr:DUF2732 family protein [Erwinia sp. JH02]NNS06010.1 DUF2732 family protein [Erwinia sp. JH02]
MKMTRQDIKKNSVTAAELVQELCTNAHAEGRKDMATKLSGRLDLLATQVSNGELSAVEIVELMREESVTWVNHWH